MRYFLSSVLAIAACQTSTTDNFQNPQPGPPATCAPIASVAGCDGGSRSYSCSSDRPDDGDVDLVCSAGSPGPLGATLYCCAPYEQSSSECAPDPALAGCGGVAIGFACTGEVSPSDADPSIACSAALVDGSASDYCCNTADIPPTCAVDPSIACSGVAAGYACAGSDAPFPAGDFTCAAVATGSGGTSYCCSPAAM